MIDLIIKMDKNAKIILLQSVIIVLISVYAAIVTIFVRDNNVIQQNIKTMSNVNEQRTLPCVNDSRKATDVDNSDPIGKIRDLIFAKNETDEMEIQMPQWLLLSTNRRDRLKRAIKKRKGSRKKKKRKRKRVPKLKSPVIVLTPHPERHRHEHVPVDVADLKWKKSALSISTERDFVIVDDIHLQVKQTGRYLVFASVHYNDTLTTRYYAIKAVAQAEQGGDAKFYATCRDHTICTQNSPLTYRDYICTTTAVVHLKENDKLQLEDSQFTVHTIYSQAMPNPHTTFWGLVKLSKIHDRL